MGGGGVYKSVFQKNSRNNYYTQPVLTCSKAIVKTPES